MKRVYLLLLVVGVCTLIGADNYKKINAIARFYEATQPKVKDDVRLVAVLLYDGSEGGQRTKDAESHDKDAKKVLRDFRTLIKKQINKQVDVFKGASRSIKEVDFISVDVSADDLGQLRTSLGMRYSPEIRLFKRGNQVKKNNKIVALSGDFAQEITISQSRIVAFVRKYFERDIQRIIQARIKAQHELDVARASAPRYTNVSLGFGYGPYGYGSPYWGWGWGWGGGWGCYRCGFGWCC